MIAEKLELCVVQVPKNGRYCTTLFPNKLAFENYSHLQPQSTSLQVSAFHKQHRGQNAEEAMLEYLKISQDLEMFGIDYYPGMNCIKIGLPGKLILRD